MLAAVGLDAGMLALAWTLAAGRRLQQPSRDLWLTVAAVAVLSGWANADAALGVSLGASPTSSAVAALAAALPLLTLALGRTVEADAELSAPTQQPAATAAPEPKGAAPEPRGPRRHQNMREAVAGG